MRRLVPIFVNDRALLDRFRAGDRDALTAVYRRYVDDVAALARRGFTIESQGHLYVAGAANADEERDLVQETFARAFAEPARRRFDGLRPYRPYVLRITKNLMIDRFRARRREPAANPSSLGIDAILEGAELDAGVELPEDLAWAELRAATREFVETLDERSQAVVRARFEEELSQKATAARLQCSRRKVRTAEARILKGLSRFLTKRGFSMT